MITVSYPDHDEVYHAGDAFYMAPGHVPAAEAGSEFIQFSPKDQLAETMAAIQANAQRIMAGELSRVRPAVRPGQPARVRPGWRGRVRPGLPGRAWSSARR